MASIDDLKELINHGEDVNRVIEGKGYIFHCIDEDNSKLVSFIIEKGADATLPNCPEQIQPLHYAILHGKNNAVLALLESQVDPNLQVERNGNTPLMTAIITDNNVALNYLIQFEADPNIPNARGETPLLHAIHKGNNLAISRLLENHAEMVNLDHSALHFAAKEGQAEACLLLMKYGVKRDLLDKHNRTALDRAINLEDPTTELLLRTPNLPQTTTDVTFVKFLNDSIEPKIEEIRDQMANAEKKFPKRVKTFISTLMTLERCHVRFVVFLRNRSIELQETVKELSRPTNENVDKDIDRLAIQFRYSLMKEIEKTTEVQEEFGKELFSPAGIETYERWVKRNEEMQAFIEEIVATGLNMYGLKDDVATRLRKARLDSEYVSNLHSEIAAKTAPFQEEIVCFVAYAIKKLKTMQLRDPLDVYVRFLKMLLRQIEETNPELIRRVFKRPKQKVQQSTYE